MSPNRFKTVKNLDYAHNIYNNEHLKYNTLDSIRV